VDTACCAVVIFFWAAEIALFARAAPPTPVASAMMRGQALLGSGEPAPGGRQPGARGGTGGAGHQVLVVLQVRLVAAEPVDAVEVEVLEQVLDPPPAAQPGQQRRGRGGGVAGEHLQSRGAVLEQGDLPAPPVVLERDRFIGEIQNLGGPAVAPAAQ